MAPNVRTETFGHITLTDLLRKYGSIRVRLQKFPKTDCVGAMLRIHVQLCGPFNSGTMADYLAAAYEIPPQYVLVRVVKPSPASERRSPRPIVTIEWDGHAAQTVLARVGIIGKASFDTKARAYQRWRKYRKASGSYWRDNAS